MLFLSDPIPTASHEVKPDVPWIVLEAITRRLQPKPIVVDGSCNDRPKFLFWEAEPVCRFDRLVKIKAEVAEKEIAHCLYFDAMIDGAGLHLLQELDVVVVWIGIREVRRVAAESHRELLPQRLSDRDGVKRVITLAEKHHRPLPPVVISRHLGVKTEHFRPVAEKRR